MTFAPSNNYGSSFLPVYEVIPQDLGQLNIRLSQIYTAIALSANLKEIALYNPIEQINGQQWFVPSDNNRKRLGLRTVVDFGTLPNSGTTSVAHGITVDSNTFFTRIYGCATDPSTRFIPIPYVNVGTPGDGVEIDVDTTNVNITTTTGNYTGFTTCYVVLEYLKEPV